MELHYNHFAVSASLYTDIDVQQNIASFKIKETQNGNIWHCRALGNMCDFINNNLEEDCVHIFEGRLEQHSWQDSDGKDRRSISFRVTRIHLYED